MQIIKNLLLKYYIWRRSYLYEKMFDDFDKTAAKLARLGEEPTHIMFNMSLYMAQCWNVMDKSNLENWLDMNKQAWLNRE